MVTTLATNRNSLNEHCSMDEQNMIWHLLYNNVMFVSKWGQIIEFYLCIQPKILN